MLATLEIGLQKNLHLPSSSTIMWLTERELIEIEKVFLSDISNRMVKIINFKMFFYLTSKNVAQFNGIAI